MIERRSLGAPALVVMASALACSDWEAGDDLSSGAGGESAFAGADCPDAFDPDLAEEQAVPRGFRVVGNRIEDAEGEPVVLRGVNRSGSEYECTKGTGFFDGAVNEDAVRAMARWKINAVRVPLNESCWLSIGDSDSEVMGDNYQRAIRTYVDSLQRYGLIPILELHWAAPGNAVATRQLPMPNADHSEDFWADVAETFLDDDAVILEPYNEPYPDRSSDEDAAWECWRDGCEECSDWDWGTRQCNETYEAVGMQALVDAIRATGSEHLILLGGVRYSNALSGWLEHKPSDPLNNLAPAWHIYNFNACSHEDCWNDAPLRISEEFPIVVTELGQNDCEEKEFVGPLVEWLEAHEIGYLAWTWNAYGACAPETRESVGNPFSLITSYTCPQPNGGFADTFYQALEEHAP
jgi:hypothetical protein